MSRPLGTIMKKGGALEKLSRRLPRRGPSNSSDLLKRPLDPSSVGLTSSQVEERSKDATTPMYVPKDDGKVFSMRSTARMQQVMKRGTASKSAEMMANKLAEYRKTVVFISFVGMVASISMFIFAVKTFLAPNVNARNLREERANKRPPLRIWRPSPSKREPPPSTL